jgi:hypothetical protein
MKKIPIIFLTLLIALTFSNANATATTATVTTHIDEDENCACYEYRCKISYFKKEPHKDAKKHTIGTQFINNYYCEKGSKVFLKKMEEWLHGNSFREIVGLSSAVQCKSRDGWTWYVYHKCKPEYREGIIKELKKKYPNRVHIDILN